MPKIAISYRRSDSTVIAGRILDRLAANYGPESVFMDVHSIPYGTDFREYIQTALAGIDVLLVIIGPHWIGDPGTNPTRISDNEDLVRIEVETALKRGVLVIPVLIAGAMMPSASQLPLALKPLAARNAAVVDGGRDFHPHMERMIQAIDQIFPVVPQLRSAPPSLISARSPGQPEVEKTFPSVLRDILVSTLCVLLAHYVLVVALDLSTLYLRVASIVVPLISAILLYRNARPTAAVAAFVALATALLAVVCMAVVVGLSFGHSILPATRYEWRETVEYFASIGGSFFVGYLLVPSIRKSLWPHGIA